MKTNYIHAVELMRKLRDQQNERINQNPEKFFTELRKYDAEFSNSTKVFGTNQNISIA
jgi:hypothetical protein